MAFFVLFFTLSTHGNDPGFMCCHIILDGWKTRGRDSFMMLSGIIGFWVEDAQLNVHVFAKKCVSALNCFQDEHALWHNFNLLIES